LLVKKNMKGVYVFRYFCLSLHVSRNDQAVINYSIHKKLDPRFLQEVVDWKLSILTNQIGLLYVALW
jgi:hypothetical protein